MTRDELILLQDRYRESLTAASTQIQQDLADTAFTDTTRYQWLNRGMSLMGQFQLWLTANEELIQWGASDSPSVD